MVYTRLLWPDFGYWAGKFMFLISPWTELFTFDYTLANFFICGWISAGTSYMLSMAVDDDGIKINNQYKSQ